AAADGPSAPPPRARGGRAAFVRGAPRAVRPAPHAPAALPAAGRARPEVVGPRRTDAVGPRRSEDLVPRRAAGRAARRVPRVDAGERRGRGVPRQRGAPGPCHGPEALPDDRPLPCGVASGSGVLTR